MLNTSIVYPMAALVFFTFLYSLYMFKTRVQAVKSGAMKANYFKTYDEGQPPRSVVQASRHYSNLFELPVLFYATCLVTMTMGLESSFSVICAWGFVLARVVHAYIHSFSNKLRPRMMAFGIGWLFILGMWIQILRFL